MTDREMANSLASELFWLKNYKQFARPITT